ncbi:V-type proton ATPase subunit e [Drosophila hydei]|uniref:V-type proton ATPase subunit e n=1 Tax=Drosophila hydei TaxID=7224 RepID=A0A6J1M9I7_DROHY|nr:V-type proton ATPase subunit e [Drosophila hydei]
MNKYVSLIIFTVFWALFAGVGCIVAKYFKERTLIRCCVLLTAACCWLVWLVTFLMQLNPLVGPRLQQMDILGMLSYWESSYIHSEPDP